MISFKRYAIRDLNYFSSMFIIINISKYCPQQCETTSYVVQTKFLGIGSIIYNGINRISFYACYKSLKYTEINQKPEILFIDFISNVGGIMGIFLGISFLSFIEIIELTFEAFVILLDYKKKIQRVEHENQSVNLEINSDFLVQENTSEVFRNLREWCDKISQLVSFNTNQIKQFTSKETEYLNEIQKLKNDIETVDSNLKTFITSKNLVL